MEELDVSEGFDIYRDSRQSASELGPEGECRKLY